MLEKPILFTPWSVRHIIEGRKTQTRRTIKPQPVKWDTVRRKPYRLSDEARIWSPLTDHSEDRISPYAEGTRLWVRESWAKTEEGLVLYKADHQMGGIAWKSPLMMPRSASRTLLEVAQVRVERVQEISAADCIAEGCNTNLREQEACEELRDQYRRVWDSINKSKELNWDANPWVWVVSFRHARETKLT